MKQNASNSSDRLFSKTLINEISSRLKKSEQIIILQNRRGFARIQQCADCGEIKRCRQCSVALTFHRTDNSLHCHYCNFVDSNILSCAYCISNNLFFTGSGTQKIEELLQNKFPHSIILRMDMDTVQRRGAHLKTLKKFSNGEADILLGTQMIAKGLDFENVTLVGVINADSELFFPDFRSGERVFQLLYQVAGRAGRRKKPGLAIIQTHNPENIYIQLASVLDTKTFYNVSLAQRQELNYPPFSRIARILFVGKNRSSVEKLAIKTSDLLKKNLNINILGPVIAPLEKIKGNWRVHLLIKTKRGKQDILYRFIQNTLDFSIFEKKWSGVRIHIDVDPISML